jgi:hypothetical protein
LSLLGGDPDGFWKQDPLNQQRLMAYWQLTHSTDQITASKRGSRAQLKPSDLRRMLARAASLGDLMEAWLLTHPKPKGADRGLAGEAVLRKRMEAAGSSKEGVDWFLRGD